MLSDYKYFTWDLLLLGERVMVDGSGIELVSCGLRVLFSDEALT